MDVKKYQDPAVIQAALSERRVAIVGLSANPLRASHFVGLYLQRHGYEILPVNPREERILGVPSYPTLTAAAATGPIGLVDVFRAPAAVPAIAEEAVAISAAFLWLQFGVISAEGVEIAEAGGLQCIVDACTKIEHARYRGRMHWLGFNTRTVSAQRRPSQSD